MTFLRLALCVIAAAAPLAGCASIISGSSQSIQVTSNPPGAACNLHRDGQIIASVNPTPGGVSIQKTKHDIQVRCEKPGYTPSEAWLDSEIEGATFGNIVLGGGIGWAIDSASGSDNSYPNTVTVTLSPLPGTAAVPSAAVDTPPGAVVPEGYALVPVATPTGEVKCRWADGTVHSALSATVCTSALGGVVVP